MATRESSTSGAASFGASAAASRYLASATTKLSASYAASPAASAMSTGDPVPRDSLVVTGSGAGAGVDSGGACGVGAGSGGFGAAPASAGVTSAKRGGPG